MAGETDRVAVITGASSGIGFAAARALAADGWRVIALGRDRARIAQSDAALRAQGLAAQWIQADFASLAETRRAAEAIAASAARIDLLVNNAGALLVARHVTADGLETTFQVNHLAPFVLTCALSPQLAASRAAQVITISSVGHTFVADMQWDDLMLEHDFMALRAYAQSKLANLLFTRELAKRGSARGIVASAVHPGLVASRFPESADEATRGYYAEAVRSGEALTGDEGADTIVWLAQDPRRAAPSGGYFHQRERIDPSPAARSDESAARLWAISEELAAGG